MTGNRALRNYDKKCSVCKKDFKGVHNQHEGAVSEVERDGNDSPEELKNLEEARADLMELLKLARQWEEDREKSVHPSN